MKKIYLVRHGESTFNAGQTITVDEECVLTELGHSQAEFIAERAKKLGAEIIIASPLRRAQQTAQHIADATGLAVDTSELLIERRYPSGQLGLTLAHPMVQEIIHLLEARFGDEDARHSDEETFEEIRERAVKTLDYLKHRPEGTLLVVSHSIFLRVLLAVVVFGPGVTRQETGKILNAFKTKNTGVTLLEYDEEKYPSAPWYVRTWNDHAHLG